MVRMYMVLFLAGLLFSTCFGLEIQSKEFKTANGTVYRDAHVKKENDYEAVVTHAVGKSRVPLEMLPDDMKEKLRFDYERAEYAKEEVLQKRRKQLEATARYMEERENEKLRRQYLRKKAEEDDIENKRGKISKMQIALLDGRVNLGNTDVYLTKKEVVYVSQAAYSYGQLRNRHSEHYRLVMEAMEQCKNPDILKYPDWPVRFASESYRKLDLGERYGMGLPPNGFTEQKGRNSLSDRTQAARDKKLEVYLEVRDYYNLCQETKEKLLRLKAVRELQKQDDALIRKQDEMSSN